MLSFSLTDLSFHLLDRELSVVEEFTLHLLLLVELLNVRFEIFAPEMVLNMSYM